MNLKEIIKKMSKEQRRHCWFDNVLNESVRKELIELRRAFNANELGHVSMSDAYRAARLKYPDDVCVSAQTFASWLRSGASG